MTALAARLREAPPLADPAAAADKLADLAGEALRVAAEAPEDGQARLCAAQLAIAARFAAGEVGRDEVVAALRRARAEHALLVALA
ncbi:MAG TPA: hypothetical protein VM434_12115, partial [Beijerinckiaceae bacterium]|nr:hypothetical protein [Beijerinckiaceae bacterium]